MREKILRQERERERERKREIEREREGRRTGREIDIGLSDGDRGYLVLTVSVWVIITN